MPTQVKPMASKLPQHDREEAAERFRQETVSRWEEYCNTGRSVPHDAVMKWLESWGTDSETEAPNGRPMARRSTMLNDL